MIIFMWDVKGHKKRNYFYFEKWYVQFLRPEWHNAVMAKEALILAFVFWQHCELFMFPLERSLPHWFAVRWRFLLFGIFFFFHLILNCCCSISNIQWHSGFSILYTSSVLPFLVYRHLPVQLKLIYLLTLASNN